MRDEPPEKLAPSGREAERVRHGVVQLILVGMSVAMGGRANSGERRAG
jgi:hypothetical protein